MRLESSNLSSVRGPTMQTAEDWLVPAPMREEANGNNQPLDLAGATLMLSVANVVPAPRLELGTP